jgi:hypothetical protein
MVEGVVMDKGHLRFIRLILFLLLVAVGCAGSTREASSFHPVSGKILLNGKPAAKAKVESIPLGFACPRPKG